MCYSVKAIELLTSSLATEVSTEEIWCSHLHVNSIIDRFSASLIHFLVVLMGQSWIYK